MDCRSWRLSKGINRTVASKRTIKRTVDGDGVTVGNTKDNTVTPFASLANTGFVWRLGDGVTYSNG